MSAIPKAIVQTLENYAKSQLTFAHSVAEFAIKPVNVQYLYENRIVEIVQPLVTNIDPTVRTNAVLALSRMAGNSESCAKRISCMKNLLNTLLRQIADENKFYKKYSMCLIRNLSKYPSVSSEIIIKECEGMYAILTCMKDTDPFVREVALKAISSIAFQDANLSQLIIKSGVLPQIVQCLKEPQLNLKLNALSTLDVMAKYNYDLAKTIVAVPTLPEVINLLSSDFTDIKVQKSALTLIKNIIKHSLKLTEKAIESHLFPTVLLLMAHPVESVRNKSADVVNQVLTNNEFSQMIVDGGGIVSLLNVISCRKELPPESAIRALGSIASLSPLLATAVIQSKALVCLKNVLNNELDDECTKVATIWTLGMIGQHTPSHSKSVCACGAITAMIDIYASTSEENDIRCESKNAIINVLNKCDNFTTLEQLLKPSTPSGILAFVLIKISKILPKNYKARRCFITNGHLKMIQNLEPEAGSELFSAIEIVNCCFPQDVIQMISGDYPESVLKAVDKYVPKNPECLAHHHL